jgi:hypothetical protein
MCDLNSVITPATTRDAGEGRVSEGGLWLLDFGFGRTTIVPLRQGHSQIKVRAK